MSQTINSYKVSELVPHSSTMSLLDRVTQCEDDSLVAEVDITDTTLFCEPEKGVPAWVGIEYMAQAVAAWAGVKAKHAGQPVRIGFLLGSRKYTSDTAFFPLGATLTVEVARAYQQEGLGVFECVIRIEQEVARAAINVYQPD